MINQAKTASVTATNQAENTVNVYGYVKSGQPYNYDSQLTYDGQTPEGQEVYYDAVGVAPTITNLAKS